MLDERPDEGKYALRRYKGIIAVVIISILAFVAMWEFDSVVAVINRYLGYISPVLYGICIAYILNPIVVFFERRLKKSFL